METVKFYDPKTGKLIMEVEKDDIVVPNIELERALCQTKESYLRNGKKIKTFSELTKEEQKLFTNKEEIERDIEDDSNKED